MRKPKTKPLTPIIGYGYSEATGEYEQNAAERRDSLRGGRWWIKQAKKYAQTK